MLSLSFISVDLTINQSISQSQCPCSRASSRLNS